MKKTSIEKDEQAIPEIEFSSEQLASAVRGKYFNLIKQGSNVIVLRPEIQKVFSTSEAVNEALASLITFTAHTQALVTPTAVKRSAKKRATA